MKFPNHKYLDLQLINKFKKYDFEHLETIFLFPFNLFTIYFTISKKYHWRSLSTLSYIFQSKPVKVSTISDYKFSQKNVTQKNPKRIRKSTCSALIKNFFLGKSRSKWETHSSVFFIIIEIQTFENFEIWLVPISMNNIARVLSTFVIDKTCFRLKFPVLYDTSNTKDSFKKWIFRNVLIL